MSARGHAAFIAAAVAFVAAAAAAGLLLHPARSSRAARYTPDVVFPHSGTCARPDPVTGPPCRAVHDLLLGANNGDPALYCHTYAPRPEYAACRAGVAFSDPGFSEFQTVGFRVKTARLVVDGVAIVRVRIWPFSDGGPPGDVLIALEREHGWYRVIGYQAAPPLPAS